VTVAGLLVEELFVLQGSSVPVSPSGASVMLTRDARSGVECQAQLNTSRRLGTTSR
jgi:hypothetical protein